MELVGALSTISAVVTTLTALLAIDTHYLTTPVHSFSNAAISHRPVVGLLPQSSQHNNNIKFTTKLFDSGGPPPYQKFEGLVQNVENVGKGSYLLTIDYDQKNLDDDDETKNSEGYPQYEPGHVFALEIQSPPLPPSSDDGETEIEGAESSLVKPITDKTKKDLEKNDGWLRGPYTVSFGYGTDDSADDTHAATNDGFKVLVKEVGYKSHIFATAKPGTPVVFGGRFHVPIAEGIRSAAAAVEESIDDDGNNENNRGETKRVIMVSTGVGVGPCVGAIEQLLTSSEETIHSIDLIASYRTREEISMVSALEKFQKESNDGTSEDGSVKRPYFHWKTAITSEDGRLSSNGPEALRDDYLRLSLPANSETTDISPVSNTHYHIIGNGQLVSEWKEGLAKAGVPSSRVTVEAYFNHSAKPDSGAIDTICEAVLGLESANRAKNNERETVISS